MDFNKITAELDFVGSSVHNVEIKSDMIRISNSTKKSFGLDIKCSKPLVKDNEKFGKLLMQVEVSLFKEDEELEPDSFKIVIEGVFKASNETSDEKFMELLNVNGGAALFSIARSKIEMLSSMTYAEGKIVLPMINIIQYFAERNTPKNDE
ncbi:MAG: hypothetical protein E7620_06855 [Ruminococcaceae bacterium]|nr:hypothetical protein [Oscillospiraceae bacterium]